MTERPDRQQAAEEGKRKTDNARQQVTFGHSFQPLEERAMTGAALLLVLGIVGLGWLIFAVVF